MNTITPTDPVFISILGRAFEIMERLLCSDLPMGVSQLSRETGIPKANTFHILKCWKRLVQNKPLTAMQKSVANRRKTR